MTARPEDLYPLILASLTEGVFTVDADFRLTYLNDEAERITGIHRDEALGRPCYEVLRGSRCQQGCPLRRSIETGEPQRNVQVTMLDAQMRSVPICVSTAVMTDDDGALVGGVEVFRDVSEVEQLRRQLSGQRVFHDIVGVSAPMRALFEILPDVAASEAPVLIEGPSGTGKELVARALHDLSPRRDGPFVVVNCGALPETLVESELFGHRRGAFTDARRDRAGRFQRADGGTLFLDEIGDLPLPAQVKLLRALQEGEIQPLGADETVTVDVRIVAATHRALAHGVDDGAFREDLYYRLAVVPLTLPPLRERREDVLPLIEHLLPRLASRRGSPVRDVAPAALRVLLDHDYPGNVRELINLLERALVLCHGERIELGHLPEEVRVGGRGVGMADRDREHEHEHDHEYDHEYEYAHDHEYGPRITDHAYGQRPTDHGHGPRTTDHGHGPRTTDHGHGPRTTDHGPGPRPTPSDHTRLLATLQAHAWRREPTARALGISRTTLWRRMKAAGLLARSG